MKITVFGATGMVGKRIVAYALEQGHKVTAFGRNIESLIDADITNENLTAIKGYVFDEESVYNVIKNQDAVISVLGGSFDGTDKTRSLGIKNIISQMNKAGVKRIVALAGLGILESSDGTLLMDKPGYPEEFLPVGEEHRKAYLYLKESTLDWTMIGAPNLLDADATGNYHTSTDHVPVQNANEINTGDLALFMVSEAVKNQYVKHRVGISNSA